MTSYDDDSIYYEDFGKKLTVHYTSRKLLKAIDYLTLLQTKEHPVASESTMGWDIL